MELQDNYFVKIDTGNGVEKIPTFIPDVDITIPRLVYKYLDINLQHNRNSLIEKYAWFSDPLTFNDPFDRPVPFANYLLKEDDKLFREYYSAQFSYQFRFMSEFEISQFVQRHLVYFKLKQKEEEIVFDLNERSKFLSNQIASETGVFSTCLENDRILLWSHYAGKHSGICLGFKTNDLLIKHKGIGIAPIRYGDFPIIKPFDENDSNMQAQAFPLMFLTKAPCWSHESEFRFMDHNCKNRKKNIEDSLESLILGVETNYENQEFAIATCKLINPDLKVFRAVQKQFKYEIEIEPL